MSPMAALPLAFVLVHGGHVGAWVWDEVRSQLQWPSFAVNLPGHGQRQGSVGALTFADRLAATRAELPMNERYILVGHSLGAAVVLPPADELSERTAHVVVLAGPVPRPGGSVFSVFPLMMRLVSQVVMTFSGPEFTQSPRLAESTLLNGLASESASR